MTPRRVTPRQSRTPDVTDRGDLFRLLQVVLALALLVVLIDNSLDKPVAAQTEQTAQPAAKDEPLTESEPAPAEAAPLSGALQISLIGSNGAALSGSFAVVDAAGAYVDLYVSDGTGWAEFISPGLASVTQTSVTPDFQPVPQTVVTIPSGSVAQLQFVNVFMDADNDTVGDSVDACEFGNDVADADGDGNADACDPTPNGEPTMAAQPAATTESIDATVMPESSGGDLTSSPAADPSTTGTVEASSSAIVDASPVPEFQESAVSVEVAQQSVVVESSRISCDRAENTQPTVTSDMADYPPGSLVTLTGDGWVPGQIVEILVDDDGIADAEHGPWSHSGVATASSDGRLSYQFNIAPWYVANYTVVATGECSEARTAFTDSVTGGNCQQVSTTDVVATDQYIMFWCPSVLNLFRIGVSSISAGWQWAVVYSDDANLAPPSYSSLNWRQTGTSGESAGLLKHAYLFLSPISTALPGATGSILIQVRTQLLDVVLYTSTLTGYKTITASDFQTTCTPASSTVAVPGTQQVSCTLSGINLASTATVSVGIPSLTAPTGWTATSPSPASGSVTQAASFSFSFTFTSSCSASTTAQSVGVSSSLTFRTLAVSGPASSVGIARASGTIASVGITSSTLTWARPYALSGYSTNSGSIIYSVQATGCNGWNVTVSATNFAYSGPNSGSPISSSNLTLTGSTTLPIETGMSAPATSGSLGSALKVLSASPSHGIGTYSQTLTLNLNVPAGVIAGTYQATVTIAVASGP